MFARLRKKLEDEAQTTDLSKTLLSQTETASSSGRPFVSPTPRGSTAGSPTPQSSKRRDSDATPPSTRRSSLDGSADSLEAYQAAWSRREREWKVRLKKMALERKELEEKLQHTESQLQNLVENQEEMSSFQTQEMSKIKHLLLQREQEVKSYEGVLVKKQAELDSIRSTLEALRSQTPPGNMAALQKERDDLKAELDHLKMEALKANGLLEEKDNLILSLTERVELLERREKDRPLTTDQQINSLQTERDIIEKKLFETRLQLTEIKKTWSEKINSLENQISHLTGKMAEDSGENAALSAQLRQVASQLKEKEQTCWDLEDKLASKIAQVKRLEETKAESDAQHQADLQQLEFKLQEETSRLTGLLDSASTKVTQLENVQTEQLEKELEMEKKLVEKENNASQLKGELQDKEKEIAALHSRISSLSTQMTELKEQSEKWKHDCQGLDALRSSLEAERRLNQSLNHEKDELMLRNAELSQKVELARQAANQEAGLAYKVETLEAELLKANTKMVELSHNGSIKDHKKRIQELESKVAEQAKELKRSHLRVADLKKTLQKELKAHYGSDDSATEDGGRKVAPPEEDTYYQYLKYVIFKFMTVPENEAQHLIKIVSTLLHFTPQEEERLRLSLDTRSSWFSSLRGTGATT